MNTKWLNSAAFAPENEGGAAVVDDKTKEAPVAQGGAPETPAPDKVDFEAEAKPRVETVAQSLKRAIKETKAKDPLAKIAPAKSADPLIPGGAEKADAGKGSEAPVTGNTETPQASGAPNSWKPEEKALWNELPEAARAAITRREADAAKGVSELRSKYQDIDTSIAPYAAVIKQNGVTPGQAINQLFKWHMELAGPNKAQAFQQLAKNFGIDPATLAAPPSQGAPGADNGIPDNLRPVISGLEDRLRNFEQSAAAQHESAAKQTWNTWSDGKPHVETVRGLMGQLINSDLALIQAGQDPISGTIKNGSIDLDAAYQAAIYAHPEIRMQVLQEEQAKRDATARAAAERARKAGGSLRPGAPSAQPGNGVDTGAPVVESPRESIRRAIAMVRSG